jgi:hypothetical protein
MPAGGHSSSGGWRQKGRQAPQSRPLADPIVSARRFKRPRPARLGWQASGVSESSPAGPIPYVRALPRSRLCSCRRGSCSRWRPEIIDPPRRITLKRCDGVSPMQTDETNQGPRRTISIVRTGEASSIARPDVADKRKDFLTLTNETALDLAQAGTPRPGKTGAPTPIGGGAGSGGPCIMPQHPPGLAVACGAARRSRCWSDASLCRRT